jgi:hypothetical protein
MDYRVRIRMFKIAPQIKKGTSWKHYSFRLLLILMKSTSNRLCNSNSVPHPRVFDSQQFAGASIKYSYENYDNLHCRPWNGFSIGGSDVIQNVISPIESKHFNFIKLIERKTCISYLIKRILVIMTFTRVQL